MTSGAMDKPPAPTRPSSRTLRPSLDSESPECYLTDREESNSVNKRVGRLTLPEKRMRGEIFLRIQHKISAPKTRFHRIVLSRWVRVLLEVSKVLLTDC